LKFAASSFFDADAIIKMGLKMESGKNEKWGQNGVKNGVRHGLSKSHCFDQ
jgi:hypothetical protein